MSLSQFINKYYPKSIPKWQMKLFLSFAAFVIVLIVIVVTQLMAQDLIKREEKLIKYYTDSYHYYSNQLSSSENDFSTSNVDNFLHFIQNINPTISFPVIQADENGNPKLPLQDYTLNIEVDKNLTKEQQKEYLLEMIEDMSSDYDPIQIEINGKIMDKFYYTNSDLVIILKYAPLAAIAVVSAFVLVGYLAFSSFRRNEEKKVWVGMAKEAAHQLGTPLSSLMAWMEILKLGCENPNEVNSTVAEMQEDISRLNKITTRFSKIGSQPEMSKQSINDLIEKVCEYFDTRLPHLGRKVDLQRTYQSEISANINPELFEWVFENLIKNAAEAIERKDGFVKIYMRQASKNRLIITVEDNGKGLNSKQKHQIFNPGYTTKKRGWGLGLSLVKRIVEQYHNGKIFVKESSPGLGTTFQIEIPL